MKNRCPKCGYAYSDNDIFCSMCGTQVADRMVENNIQKNDGFLKSVFKFVQSKFKNSSINYYLQNKNLSYDNVLINIIFCMIALSIALSVAMYFLTNGSNLNKPSLEFNNYIQNPERIPELREPKTFEEFLENIKSVENFMDLFLKYSKESDEKKKQIFISYLNEMEKVEHISTENVLSEYSVCDKISSIEQANTCNIKLNKSFSNTGVLVTFNLKTVYLYPNYSYIKKKFSKYFSGDVKEYLNLRAKYTFPVSSGIVLNTRPQKLANKVLDFEKLYLSATEPYVKDSCEEILYKDFRQLLFNPSVYDTTTHEIKSKFKNAYKHIARHKKSALSPVVISCLEKGRVYSEDNFKNDYPYKLVNDSFEENVSNINFTDIFAQLRKNIVHNSTDLKFKYIFSLKNSAWFPYDSQRTLDSSDYIVSEPDVNNNVFVYNNTFSLVDEINISKYSNLFLANDKLFVFNRGRLQISKVFFNGRNFALRTLSGSDITSLFPGIEVINIDSYSNYNIYIEKDNKNATYIILSRYSQGYENYVLSGIKGDFQQLQLPVMFNVNSLDDVLVSFHSNSIDPDTTSESSPTYKFTIHTRGHETKKIQSDRLDMYDEKTAADEEENETYKPNIIPKLNNKSEVENKNTEEQLLVPAPSQLIDDASDE